jgi:hypothetical protein
MSNHESALLRALGYIHQTRAIVARQRDRVARLDDIGVYDADADRTLRVFERSLATFEAHERYLTNEMTADDAEERRKWAQDYPTAAKSA